MEIWNPNFLSASTIRKLQESGEEFRKLIENVSTGENALTEEEVSEMKLRYFIRGIYEVVVAGQDKKTQKILSNSLSPEGKKRIKENFILVKSVLREIKETETQKKVGEKV